MYAQGRIMCHGEDAEASREHRPYLCMVSGERSEEASYLLSPEERRSLNRGTSLSTAPEGCRRTIISPLNLSAVI
ncbi:unnamed protein product [Lasius platythorax]|uniref:Uncharacterized protein n=1 Tax=Lasius platythorax TaxID=488582 RepID=A0AAV2P909_9HYME